MLKDDFMGKKKVDPIVGWLIRPIWDNENVFWYI